MTQHKELKAYTKEIKESKTPELKSVFLTTYVNYSAPTKPKPLETKTATDIKAAPKGKAKQPKPENQNTRQAKEFLDKMEKLYAKGHRKFGLTYSANAQQTKNVKDKHDFSWNNRKGLIIGDNQAEVMMEIDRLLATDDYAYLQESYYIIPITTMYGGKDYPIPENSANADIQFMNDFLKNNKNAVILGWQNQFSKLNDDKPFAVGGGVASKLSPPLRLDDNDLQKIQTAMVNLAIDYQPTFDKELEQEFEKPISLERHQKGIEFQKLKNDILSILSEYKGSTFFGHQGRMDFVKNKIKYAAKLDDIKFILREQKNLFDPDFTVAPELKTLTGDEKRYRTELKNKDIAGPYYLKISRALERVITLATKPTEQKEMKKSSS